MSVRERECGELPYPICPCSTERSGGDLCFLGRVPDSFPRKPGWHLVSRRDGIKQIHGAADAEADPVRKNIERIKRAREQAVRPEILADLGGGARGEE